MTVIRTGSVTGTFDAVDSTITSKGKVLEVVYRSDGVDLVASDAPVPVVSIAVAETIAVADVDGVEQPLVISVYEVVGVRDAVAAIPPIVISSTESI